MSSVKLTVTISADGKGFGEVTDDKGAHVGWARRNKNGGMDLDIRVESQLASLMPLYRADSKDWILTSGDVLKTAYSSFSEPRKIERVIRAVEQPSPVKSSKPANKAIKADAASDTPDYVVFGGVKYLKA